MISRLTDSPNFYRFDMFTIIVLTVLGLLQGEVTVFYIIYLFWFQEAIRTLVDGVFVVAQRSKGQAITTNVGGPFGGFFLLFIYLVFIILLFGIMLNWGNNQLMYLNLNVLFFRNWFFNTNLILFTAQYIFYRREQRFNDIHLGIFNSRHVILHLSIIIGAMIQMFILKRYQIESLWGSVAVIAPFLIIKVIVDKIQVKKIQG